METFIQEINALAAQNDLIKKLIIFNLSFALYLVILALILLVRNKNTHKYTDTYKDLLKEKYLILFSLLFVLCFLMFFSLTIFLCLGFCIGISIHYSIKQAGLMRYKHYQEKDFPVGGFFIRPKYFFSKKDNGPPVDLLINRNDCWGFFKRLAWHVGGDLLLLSMVLIPYLLYW